MQLPRAALVGMPRDWPQWQPALSMLLLKKGQGQVIEIPEVPIRQLLALYPSKSWLVQSDSDGKGPGFGSRSNWVPRHIERIPGWRGPMQSAAWDDKPAIGTTAALGRAGQRKPVARGRCRCTCSSGGILQL